MSLITLCSLGRVTPLCLFSRSILIWGTLSVMAWGAIAPGKTAIAQITPDLSLGTEQSIVRPNVFSPHGHPIDRIDGGAIRGQNLFHSFSDFNVNSQQRVYFSNPAVIDTIISRVTGTTHSDILGTLGVLGNADLFLINPNGIVFGPDAVLDLSGSLTASTADHIAFENGYLYSATTANAPPLLNVHSPIAGLASWLPQGGLIRTTGDLSVDHHLVLTAENVDLQGRLVAGGDVRAIATHQLTATDRRTVPLTLSAGQQLLLQGNQSLELSALDHPLSRMMSGENMILRSNSPIVGDAIFTAGGNIRIEQVNGTLGSIISIEDPVFQTAGDFAMDSYTGASLQILAGGSVTIPGEILIDGAGGPFNDGTVTLSNGTPVALRGSTDPTVDIRAGTTEFFGSPELGRTPTNANITIGSIVNPGGTVFLTNQFQANPALSGDISVGLINTVDFGGGGNVILDSRGGITSGGIDASGGDLIAFINDGDFDALTGNGGNITFLANQDIVIPHQSFISSYGLRGGNIVMDSDTAITQEDGPNGSPAGDLSFIESATSGSQPGGSMTLSAPNLSIGGNVLVDNYGSGQGGNLSLSGQTLLANQASIGTSAFGAGQAGTIDVEVDTLTLGARSSLGSVTFGGGGNTGDIIVQATSITATGGSQIASAVFGAAGPSVTAGDITIMADTISLVGFDSESITEGTNFNGSAIASTVNPGSEGNSGNIFIQARTLQISDGGSVATSSFGDGNAGAIAITVDEQITVDGAVFPENLAGIDNSVSSTIQSELFTGATGQAGNITIVAPIIKLTNGGSITTLSDGAGDAGSISITATESLLVDGVVFFPQDGVDNRLSRIAVLTESESTGNAGILRVEAPAITLSNGGEITAESRGIGQGGVLDISGHTLVLENGGELSTETTSNTGGDIFLRIDDVISMTGGSRISATAGTAGAGGDGGNIIIDSTFVTVERDGNNDITANAFEGSGGRVGITAEGIFGLVLRSRTELESLLGTTDPARLDPINLPTSDITAISQSNPSLDGVVIIRSPDVDPSRSIIELPTNVTDASRLITQGCSAGGAIAQELGSLIITGRGGLPQAPGEPLSHPDLLLEWEAFGPNDGSTSDDRSDGRSGSDRPIPPLSQESSTHTDYAQTDYAQTNENVREQPSAPTDRPTVNRLMGNRPAVHGQILEVQALSRRADGKVVLMAHTPTNLDHHHWHQRATCVRPIP
ncbi:MAG: filamentous hemagglutinin N-terminal domain-containing protein [Merismopedia sp. SIO2A8]|nr:filamentous hemagglutinin N-terminal domain-containing protein [Merismopedia sp. SIO2A8]